MAELVPPVVLEEIRENQKRLDNCKRHYFPTLPPVEVIRTSFRLKLSCAACGGEILATEVAAYVRGFAAAGGNPDLIIPGWSGA